MMRLLLLFLMMVALSGAEQDPADGIRFHFRGTDYLLDARIRLAQREFFPRTRPSRARLDTLCNWYSPARKYVEIIRQDNARLPRYGIALGFEFNPEPETEYPYFPEYAVIQFKDFTWGGTEFGITDSLNFTGVYNEVSEDVWIEVDGYVNDTIYGTFSGVLINGAGGMEPLEDGRFRVRVYPTE